MPSLSELKILKAGIKFGQATKYSFAVFINLGLKPPALYFPTFLACSTTSDTHDKFSYILIFVAVWLKGLLLLSYFF